MYCMAVMRWVEDCGAAAYQPTVARGPGLAGTQQVQLWGGRAEGVWSLATAVAATKPAWASNTACPAPPC